jgi:hypothetical protein
MVGPERNAYYTNRQILVSSVIISKALKGNSRVAALKGPS